jgi:hypothetical protein
MTEQHRAPTGRLRAVFSFLAMAFVCLASVAEAQWQVPQYARPIGRGVGQGFDWVQNGTIYAKQFGVRTTGTSVAEGVDDTNAWASVITYVNANPFTTVVLSEGYSDFTAMSAITANGIYFICEGPGPCVLRHSSTNAITWSGVNYGGMRGVQLQNSGATTNISIKCSNAGYLTFKDMILNTGVGTFAALGETSNSCNYATFDSITGTVANSAVPLFDLINGANFELFNSSVQPNANVGEATAGRYLVRIALTAPNIWDAFLLHGNDMSYWDMVLNASITSVSGQTTGIGPGLIQNNVFDSSRRGSISINLGNCTGLAISPCAFLNQLTIANNFFTVHEGNMFDSAGGSDTRLWALRIADNFYRSTNTSTATDNGIAIVNTGYVHDLQITGNLIYNLDADDTASTAGIQLTGGTHGGLSFDAQTGNFTLGQTLTGTNSGATATITAQADNGTTGILFLTSISGTFEDNEAITDPVTGAAVANGAVFYGYRNISITGNHIASDTPATVLSANVPDYGILIQGTVERATINDNMVRGALYGINTQALLTSIVEGNTFVGVTAGCAFNGITTSIVRNNTGCQTAATTTALTAVEGGTGLASYTIGDMLYADTTTSLAKRAAVATGSLLGSQGTGTAPAWLSNVALGGYLRVGSASAPANTTAGDITGVRLSIGNSAFSQTNGMFARIAGTATDTSSTSVGTNTILTISPSGASTASARAATVSAFLSTSNNITSGTQIGGYFEGRISSAGDIAAIAGINSIGLLASSATALGTVTTAYGGIFQSVLSITHALTSTITNAVGIEISNLTNSGAGPLTITSQVGLRIAAMSGATNNTALLLGTTTIPTGNFGIYNTSTDQNYHAGALTLGTATLNSGEKLSVSLNATAPPAGPGTDQIVHVTQVDGTIARYLQDAFGANNIISFRRANGTNASKTAIAAADALGIISFLGYHATGTPAYTTQRVAINGVANENWTDVAQGTYLSILTTPDGSVTIAEAARFFGSTGFSVGSTTDPGAGVINAASGFSSGGTAGTSATKTVRDSAGTGTCTLIFTGGILTGGTC